MADTYRGLYGNFDANNLTGIDVTGDITTAKDQEYFNYPTQRIWTPLDSLDVGDLPAPKPQAKTTKVLTTEGKLEIKFAKEVNEQGIGVSVASTKVQNTARLTKT